MKVIMKLTCLLLLLLVLTGCRSDTVYVQIGAGAATTETPAQTTEITPSDTTEELPAGTETVASDEDMVWIPVNGGQKYHQTATCSSMIDPKQITKAEAEQQGFTPCKRCCD